MSKYGIDVSSYQGTVDWKKVKACGIEFAILKVIRKDLNPDKQFENNWAGCEAAGMPIHGAYNYSYANTVEKAVSDAKRVLEILNGRKVRVYLDVEDNCLKGLGRKLFDIIDAYAGVIIGAGLEFGVYTGSSFYNSYIKPYGTLQCPMWIASYGKNNGQMNTKPQISGINMVGWQFTSMALIDGINGYIDEDVWYEELENKKEEEEDTMALTIGHASIDENGKAIGGAVGDQSGREVCTRSYYLHSKGWYLLRPKSVTHANKIAEAMLRACKNNNIGYDQGNRTGIIKYGTGTTVKTECDCSSLVRQCVIEGTGMDSGNFTTANEVKMLQSTGMFAPTVSVTSSTVLYNGDILVTKTKGHTVIVVAGNPRKEAAPSNTYTQEQFIREVQNILGAKIDGIGGPETLSKTITVSTIWNRKHAVVRPIQKYLNSIGYDCGTVDGIAGSKFKAAVKAYQKDVVKASKKNQDGVITKKGATWKKLLGIS